MLSSNPTKHPAAIWMQNKTPPRGRYSLKLLWARMWSKIQVLTCTMVGMGYWEAKLYQHSCARVAWSKSLARESSCSVLEQTLRTVTHLAVSVWQVSGQGWISPLGNTDSLDNPWFALPRAVSMLLLPVFLHVLHRKERTVFCWSCLLQALEVLILIWDEICSLLNN